MNSAIEVNKDVDISEMLNDVNKVLKQHFTNLLGPLIAENSDFTNVIMNTKMVKSIVDENNKLRKENEEFIKSSITYKTKINELMEELDQQKLISANLRGHIFKLNMKFQNKHLTISTGNNFVQEKKNIQLEVNELNKNNNESNSIDELQEIIEKEAISKKDNDDIKIIKQTPTLNTDLQEENGPDICSVCLEVSNDEMHDVEEYGELCDGCYNELEELEEEEEKQEQEKETKEQKEADNSEIVELSNKYLKKVLVSKKEEEEEEEEEVEEEEEEVEEEEEEEEEEVEEEEEDEEEEEEEDEEEEEEEDEEEEEEEEEEEVEDVTINGKEYYATNTVDGDIYEKLKDDEIGDIVGYYKNKKPFFRK